ncbi:hypothetical protein ACLMJK_004267 [Lecanora helva]
MINELANKVPTMIKYRPGTSIIDSWGFYCDSQDLDPDVEDLFKLHLDPAFDGDGARSTQQARQWYQDYMRCIHDWIVHTFSESITRWNSRKVEFVFSVPTTWKDPSMIEHIYTLIGNAGFGKDGADGNLNIRSGDHRVSIGLTEAEAAAVYASKQEFEQNDVVLVCDAGGGTTDVNTLKLKSSRIEPTKLEQLSWVQGIPVGSMSIDRDVEELLVSRLVRVHHLVGPDLGTIAHEMMHGRFERFKCEFGTPASLSQPALALQIPGLQPGIDVPDAMIENSRIEILRDELRAIFDVHIAKILHLTDTQIDWVTQNKGANQISHFVLSGGLGSSPYVKDRIRSHYTTGPGSEKPAVQNMEVRKVLEPQLAVTQGIVMDKAHVISLGDEIIKERCCRNSYGVVAAEKYVPGIKKHLDQPVRRDARDGCNWVDDQIQWFIIQGQKVTSDGVTRPYVIKRNPGSEYDPWKTDIVMSSLPKHQLPTNIHQHGSKKICDVSSVLKNQAVDMKLKNRRWWQTGDKYWRFRFDVKVIPGHADLRFNMLTKDKKVINEDHKAIEVIWQAAPETLPVPRPTDNVPLYSMET